LEPPEPVSLLVGLCATLIAALFGVACSLAEQYLGRGGSVTDSTPPGRRGALERLSSHHARMKVRWGLLQGVSLGAAVLLLQNGLGGLTPPTSGLVAVAIAATLYAVTRRVTHALWSPRASEHLAWMVRAFRPFEWLVAPVSDPVNFLCERVVGAKTFSAVPVSVSDAEVELVINASERSGALGVQQSEIIRNVLEFGDTVASDLMVPRPQVVAIDVKVTPDELMELIRKNEHSRYPVYKDRMDNVIGILHVKDVFLFTSGQGLQKVNVRSLLRKAVFIPETQLASSVLQQLRAGRHHMAIVIDEFGGMSGLLTLEDLLEEIVGEIQDEHDDDESPVVELSNGHFVVDASIPIPELNRQVGIELPDGEEYSSLGGFIVEIMGRVPESGAVLEELGHRFLIRSADERRISKVEIIPNLSLRATG
jgi:putative hemolysin